MCCLICGVTWRLVFILRYFIVQHILPLVCCVKHVFCLGLITALRVFVLNYYLFIDLGADWCLDWFATECRAIGATDRAIFSGISR